MGGGWIDKTGVAEGSIGNVIWSVLSRLLNGVDNDDAEDDDDDNDDNVPPASALPSLGDTMLLLLLVADGDADMLDDDVDGVGGGACNMRVMALASRDHWP